MVQRLLLVSVLALANHAFAAPAPSSTVDLVNDLRIRHCPRPLADTQRLRANTQLNVAAEKALAGRVLADALAEAGVRVGESTLIRVTGSIDDRALTRALRQSYCARLTNAKLTDLGIARGKRGVVLLLALPIALPAADDAPHIAREVLRRVNEARTVSRRCGNRRLAPAPPLESSAKLDAAALAHARDMAAVDRISHRGSDRSEPADRVERAGYAWKAVGENVAAGQSTADEVVDQWLASPEHCTNIMNAEFTQMGIAFAIDPDAEIGIYWAQVFGRPR